MEWGAAGRPHRTAWSNTTWYMSRVDGSLLYSSMASLNRPCSHSQVQTQHVSTSPVLRVLSLSGGSKKDSPLFEEANTGRVSVVASIFPSEKSSPFFSWAFWWKRYCREEVFLPSGMRVPTERLGRSGGQPQQGDGCLSGGDGTGESQGTICSLEKCRKRAVCVQSGWEPGRRRESSRG